MSVLDRSELEQSHLADLHAIASELGIEGYRRLGRDALIEAILAGDADDEDTGDDESAEEAKPEAEEEMTPIKRGRGRRLRLRRDKEEEDSADGDDGEEVVLHEGDDTESAAPEPREKKERKRQERKRSSDKDEASDYDGQSDDGPSDDGPSDDVRGGVLDILPGGSGFMRADAFVHAREDVYVSPAQIRRCELRAGDEISGPVRPPRRSERYPSLVRIETVNGKPADETADRPEFDDPTPTFAREPLETVYGLPFGKGSRVAIGGPPGAGATRLLREVTDAFEGGLDVVVVLAGVRPEEVTEWKRGEGLSIAGGGFDRPPDELAQIAEMAVERAKRIVERGGDAIVVIDGLDALQPAAARRVFGAARNTEEAGSLTIVAATGSGGELQRLATTRVVLAGDGGLDAPASGTLREDLLA